MQVYVSLAVVTAATLFVEIVITRVFSLTLWFHFAFVAISLAMLGMAGGAMYVYLHREKYTEAESVPRMARLMVWFGLTIFGAYVLNLGIAFNPSFHPAALVGLSLIVGFWAVPFFLSGMIVSVALTRLPLPVGRLYAADLIGAAVGCLAVQPALAHLGPPAGLAAAGVLAVLAAWWLGSSVAWPETVRPPRTVGALALLGFLALLAAARPGLFTPKWVKGHWDAPYEKSLWNAISRVAVSPVETPQEVFGSAYGSQFPRGRFKPLPTRIADTDAFIRLRLTQFDGDVSRYGYVYWDLDYLAYRLRPSGSSAIIGSGAGRDIMAAYALGEGKITGIEINPILNRLLRNDYADFTGHIAYDPRVRLVTAEARNWIERSGERFDIIQTTFIDTQAATAAGAFALAENSIHTTEAWAVYLRSLNPNGFFTVSRWHWVPDPMETYRLTTLARKALSAVGQSDARKCVVILVNIEPDDLRKCNVLVSPSPISAQDCAAIGRIAAECGFEVLYSPTKGGEPYATLLDPARGPGWEASYHLNISPPRDDQPYFFFMIRPRDLLAPSKFREVWLNTHWPMHMSVLAVFSFLFLGVALTIGALCVTLVPLYLESGRGPWTRADWPPALYFASIGFGFIMVELGIMQRTGIALGHPLYGLQVTLFCLLLGSGIGSLLTSLARGPLVRRARMVLAAVAAATLVMSLVVGPLCVALTGTPQIVRLFTVGALMVLVGLLMGTAFPTGLAVARAQGREPLLPWLWGVNGVCSVMGAFLATVMGILVGARAATLTGALIYVAAFLCMWAYTRSLDPQMRAAQ